MVPPVQHQHTQRADKYQTGKREEFAMIVDGRQSDAEPGQVADDCPADYAERNDCADHNRLGYEQQDGRDQLHDPGSDSAPGLETQRRTNVNGLLSPAELEDERLQKKRRVDAAQSPARDLDGFRVCHNTSCGS